MGQFSNSFPKHFSYLCEYAFRFDLSCGFCEYPIIFHCLHCSPSCFDPDSLLLAHLWLGLSWIDYISANKRFSSPKTSSRKPYTSSKQQERQKHSAETTINFSSCALFLFVDKRLGRAPPHHLCQCCTVLVKFCAFVGGVLRSLALHTFIPTTPSRSGNAHPLFVLCWHALKLHFRCLQHTESLCSLPLFKRSPLINRNQK